MITINGKDYGLFYSVGVRCKYNAWLVKNQDAPLAEGTVLLAVLMNEAYNKLHTKKDNLTKEMIYSLPNREYDALEAAVDEQIKKDSEVTVEAEEEKPKKARSAESR